MSLCSLMRLHTWFSLLTYHESLNCTYCPPLPLFLSVPGCLFLFSRCVYYFFPKKPMPSYDVMKKNITDTSYSETGHVNVNGAAAMSTRRSTHLTRHWEESLERQSWVYYVAYPSSPHPNNPRPAPACMTAIPKPTCAMRRPLAGWGGPGLAM